MRVGMGYDVHKLVEGRKLIIGGVNIPYEKGLLGHSDADVLTHAIMDALLGAAAMGDIGKHFPDNDERYEGADSIMLLRHVKRMLDEKQYLIANIDATIIAQKPKMASFIPDMVQTIAEALSLSENQVNIKATTEEGLGFTGSGEGISSHAICRQCFHDPQYYEDFYFETVWPKNHVYLSEEKGMLHLNPYSNYIQGKTYELHYIVGVATDERYRRQGVMTTLMAQALSDMWDAREPITYLIMSRLDLSVFRKR